MSLPLQISLLLPDSMLLAEVLEGCRNAIDARQNVVHNGQREVHNLGHYISSVNPAVERCASFATSHRKVVSTTISSEPLQMTMSPSQVLLAAKYSRYGCVMSEVMSLMFSDGNQYSTPFTVNVAPTPSIDAT